MRIRFFKKRENYIDMPDPLSLGMIGQAAGQVAMGSIIGQMQDNRQYQQQRRMQDLSIKGSKELMDYQQKQQLAMWEATNYKAQMDQLQKAGLNPALLYGKGGGGGATTGSTGATVGTGQAGNNLIMGIQLSKQAAETRLLEAQARNLDADTKKKEGVDTDNVKADTENKVLQSVLYKYTGLEAKDYYERVATPNRGVQQYSVQRQHEASGAIAQNIFDLWSSGKLEEKSLAEIEAIVLSNSKTRAETKNIQKQFDILEENLKGAKLQNIILELEKDLQSKTGLDKDSNGLLKVIGRMLIGLGVL